MSTLCIYIFRCDCHNERLFFPCTSLSGWSYSSTVFFVSYELHLYMLCYVRLILPSQSVTVCSLHFADRDMVCRMYLLCRWKVCKDEAVCCSPFRIDGIMMRQYPVMKSEATPHYLQLQFVHDRPSFLYSPASLMSSFLFLFGTCYGLFFSWSKLEMYVFVHAGWRT